MIFNKRFGRYRLLRKVASGGMAEVFLALKRGPQQFEKVVALKCMHPHMSNDVALTEMFYQEARVGALFEHPNLVHVFDAEKIEGRHCMAMEYVAGHTLEEIANRNEGKPPLELNTALAIVAEAAAGLHHAHQQRDLDGRALELIHRDISPSNVLVGFDGSVRVFDFGVSVAATRKAAEGGNLAGKPAYMSPEQCRGKKIDQRSDIFALGIVLYEAITGQRLFKRDTQMKSIRAITEEDIAAPSSLREGVPPEVDAIVLRSLAREPGERYQTALELHAAISNFLVHHHLLIRSEPARVLMMRLFESEFHEFEAILQKGLAAPEQTEATIDLSTFGVRQPTGEAQPVIASGPEVIQVPVAPLPTPGETSIANAAAVAAGEQLQKARKLNTALGFAVILLVCSLAFSLLRPRSGPHSEGGAVAAAVANVAVSVDSVPPGGTILVDGVAQVQKTPAVLTLPAKGNTEIQIQLDGYLRASRSLALVPSAAVAPVLLQLEIDRNSPVAPIGVARIVYFPPDAQVLVDGVPRGNSSPVLVDGLVRNRDYKLRLEKAGFEPQETTLKVASTEVSELRLDLVPDVALGRVKIVSLPSAAAVRVNGQVVGETPIDGLELPANQELIIEIEKSGRRVFRQTVNLKSGELFEIRAELSAEGEREAPPAGSAPTPAAPTYELLE